MLLALVLTTVSIVMVLPVKAEYPGDITINADGPIDPSTAPIQRTGDTYTLTSDVKGDIAVEENNIVLNGESYTLFGGVSLAQVSNVTVKSFTITNIYNGSQIPKVGINLTDVTNSVVTNNTITRIGSILAMNGGIYAGIYIEGGNSNVITGNNLTNNLHGLSLYDTSNNSIIENNIVGQQIFIGLYTTGASFANSSNNRMYHNNFVGSKFLVRVSDSINSWDDGYLGNYWSDYNARYPDAIQVGDSGVYNTPYPIDTQNIDRYALTQPFNREFYTPKIPVKISVLSPVNQVFNESSVPLSFTVNKPASWMGYSLDGQDNVTITGNVTLTGLSAGLHNVTIYAKDEFDNTGASETITFNIAESFPFVPVAAASVASAGIIAVGLLVYFKKRKN